MIKNMVFYLPNPSKFWSSMQQTTLKRKLQFSVSTDSQVNTTLGNFSYTRLIGLLFTMGTPLVVSGDCTGLIIAKFWILISDTPKNKEK